MHQILFISCLYKAYIITQFLGANSNVHASDTKMKQKFYSGGNQDKLSQ